MDNGNTGNQGPSYRHVMGLLSERGVTNPETLVHPEEDFEPVLGAIALWDKEPDATPNLLAWRIRQGVGRNYKPAHSRTPVHSSEAPQPRGRTADEWFKVLRGLSYRPGQHPDPTYGSDDREVPHVHEFSDAEIWVEAQTRAGRYG